jgi:transcriptional regulator with XRE-family HTH domain
MNSQETISTLLGLKQEEIAALLQVSRGQWSMYECGKRELPAAASIQLAEMLNHVKSAKAEASKHKAQQEKQETKQKLQALLNENQYQQLFVEKKVAALEKKQAASAALVHLVDYLENHTDKKRTHIKNLLPDIQTRTKKDIKSDNLTNLIALQIKLKVLQYEGSLLKATLEE